VEHVPAPDRVALDRRDHRLRHRADELLQVEHVEPRHAVATDVPLVAAHPLIAAAAERAIAFAGEDDDTHARVLPRVGERVEELLHRLRTERVVHFRPVDRNARDAWRLPVEDVRVRLRRHPLDRHSLSPAARNQTTSRNAAGASVWTSCPAFGITQSLASRNDHNMSRAMPAAGIALPRDQQHGCGSLRQPVASHACAPMPISRIAARLMPAGGASRRAERLLRNGGSASRRS
jgi:hypothetical protein